MSDNMRALRTIVYVGSAISGLIALSVIFTACYLTIFHAEGETPKIISDWGGIIVGFYFGSFIGLAKDLMLPGSAAVPANPPNPPAV